MLSRLVSASASVQPRLWCLSLHTTAATRREEGSSADPPGFLATPEVDAATASGLEKGVQIVSSFSTHLSLGAIYSWSVLNRPITNHFGYIVPASADWSVGDISYTFSFVMGGFAWGVVLGPFLERWGPRKCGLIGAAALGSGFGISALGVSTHELYVLYLGGLTWGIANGCCYVPCITNLISWFPDRKGFASGACLAGFGG